MPDAYLILDLERQGTPRGPVIKRGLEGSIFLLSVDHSLISPRDAASGAATGKIKSLPVIITKDIDATTPMLYQALTTNERIKRAEIKFFGPHQSGYRSGMETNIYNMILESVFISQVEFSHSNPPAGGGTNNMIEKISLVFEKIEWEWTEGNFVTQFSNSRSPI